MPINLGLSENTKADRAAGGCTDTSTLDPATIFVYLPIDSARCVRSKCEGSAGNLWLRFFSTDDVCLWHGGPGIGWGIYLNGRCNGERGTREEFFWPCTTWRQEPKRERSGRSGNTRHRALHQNGAINWPTCSSGQLCRPVWVTTYYFTHTRLVE